MEYFKESLLKAKELLFMCKNREKVKRNFLKMNIYGTYY